MIFYLPSTSRVSRGFGAIHHGIDFACPIMSDVMAAADGVAVDAYPESSGYGVHVVLEHRRGDVRYRSIYGHLTEALCKPGDIIKAGQVVGHSGNTGRSSGPHLHFELRYSLSGVPVSPVDPHKHGLMDRVAEYTPAPVEYWHEAQCPNCGCQVDVLCDRGDV